MADWWLSGGISPADCVAAYQAIGAESYAASKVNLANPSTYDLTDGAAYPTWSAETGWTFNGTNQYLFAGSYPHVNTPFTVIVRAKLTMPNHPSTVFAITRNASAPWAGWAFKSKQGGNNKLGITTYGVADNISSLNTPLTDAIIAISRSGTTITYYADGVAETKTIAAFNINSAISGFQIGAFFSLFNNQATDFGQGEIYALAYYHTALTSAQIAAVSAAMNGNEPEPQTNIPVFMAHYARLRNA